LTLPLSEIRELRPVGKAPPLEFPADGNQ